MECSSATLGLMRLRPQQGGSIIESVGTFGGYSGNFWSVPQRSDRHARHAHASTPRSTRSYAVEKHGHDTTIVTHSFQFFDRAGDAAFKAFLWDGFPDVPPERVAAFRDLARSA